MTEAPRIISQTEMCSPRLTQAKKLRKLAHNQGFLLTLRLFFAIIYL